MKPRKRLTRIAQIQEMYRPLSRGVSHSARPDHVNTDYRHGHPLLGCYGKISRRLHQKQVDQYAHLLYAVATLAVVIVNHILEWASRQTSPEPHRLRH